MEIRVFTAFSGYDSQCMALDRLHQHNPDFTYELVGWAEIDKYAIQAHNAVYPQWAERNYGDISKIDWAQVPDFDLFTYSSPCQDFSQAGKQAGGTEGSGTRSSLLWECRRAILAKRPKYLLMENVAALVSQKFIRLFNAWQLELESYGYRNFAKVLNAKDYGVPQNRERIFMVSVLDETARYEFPDPMPLTIRLKDVLEKEVEERYYLSEQQITTFNNHAERCGGVGHGFGWNPTDGDVVANALLAASKLRQSTNYVTEPINTDADGCARTINAHYECMNAESVLSKPKDGYGFVRTAIKESIAAEPMIGAFRGRNPENPSERGRSNGMYKQRLEINENGTSNTLTGVQKDNVVLIPEATKDGYIPMEFGGVCYLSYPNSDTRRGRVQEGGTVAPTLTCGVENSLRRIEYGYRIRKLTEHECFRLMDMPEEYIDRIQAAGISRSQQYKMAGNSIVVACMYHIWRKLFIDTEIKTLTLF